MTDDEKIGYYHTKYKKYKEIYQQNSKYENLTNYFYEKFCLGYAYSDSLSNILRSYYPEIEDISIVNTYGEDERVILCGEVVELKYGVAKNQKKTKYCKLKINDSTGICNVMLFNDKIEQMELENGKKYEEGDILVVEGRRKGDSVFANKAINQKIKIFCKLADLRADKIEKE